LIFHGAQYGDVLRFEEDREERLLVIDLRIGELGTSAVELQLGNELLIMEHGLALELFLGDFIRLLRPLQSQEAVLVVTLIKHRALRRGHLHQAEDGERKEQRPYER